MSEIAASVSVIIPCHNGERWIASAIESVLAQEYEGLEIIVVDDGSNDQTANILNGFGSDISVITQSNAGVSAARNVGARSAAGAYVKFLDADDILPGGALGSLGKVAESYLGKVIVGRAEVIDEHGLQSAGEIGYNIGCRPETGGAINPCYLITQATHSSLWLVPRQLFIASGGFDTSTRLGEEFCFTLRLLRCGAQFVFLDSEVSYVRNHAGERLSRSGKEEDYTRLLGQIKDCVGYLSRESALPPDATLRISRMCWSVGRQCVRLKFPSVPLAYFSYARRIGGDASINGSLLYRALLRVFGANHAEGVLEIAKRAIRGFR